MIGVICKGKKRVKDYVNMSIFLVRSTERGYLVGGKHKFSFGENDFCVEVEMLSKQLGTSLTFIGEDLPGEK